MDKKKVTMQDIADEVNVSKNTVSRALNDKEGVSEELKEKIKDVAWQMGYILKEEQTKIGVLVKEKYFLESTFYAKIIEGIGNKVRGNQIEISLIAVDHKNEKGLQLPYMLEQVDFDGLIVIGKLEKKFLNLLEENDYTVVLIDYYTDDIEIDAVIMDNYRGLYLAYNHLKELGHREIGFIGNIDYFPSFRHRYYKYRMLLIEDEIPYNEEIALLEGEKAFWNYEYLKERIKSLKTMPTAWLCVNDRTAIPLLKVLRELDYQVPDDISVIAFDNVSESNIVNPPLTTIHVDKKKLGERGIEKLLWRLDNPEEPVEELFVNTRLIVRESTARLEE